MFTVDAICFQHPPRVDCSFAIVSSSRPSSPKPFFILRKCKCKPKQAPSTTSKQARVAMGLPELWTKSGPGLAGAVFGGGWWFWVDAVVCSDIKVSFLHYLPGVFATIAALMFNGVRRDELSDYSPFDDNEGCRSRTWLFLAYVIAFTSLAGSVGMLVQDALLPTTPSTWTGVAGVLQCFFCLCSGLVYWTSRTTSDY